MNYQDAVGRAQAMAGIERNAYWRGYARGARRGHFGDHFVTDEEHHMHLAAADSEDHERRELGMGYRDGLAAIQEGPRVATS